MDIEGRVLHVFEIYGDLEVHLDDEDEPGIDLDRIRSLTAKFERLYFTNAAQAGLTAKIFISRDPEFKLPTIEALADITDRPDRDLGLISIEDLQHGVALESSTPLIADAIFTGEAHDAQYHSRFGGSVYASHQGTLYVDQSPDGTNWDIRDQFDVAGGVGRTYEVDLHARYVRVYYVNGPTNQTAFRLYGKLFVI